MKSLVPKAFKDYIINFAQLYHRYRVESDQLRQVRYRIVSSFETYKNTSMITLGLTDKPGDFLPPMTLIEVKQSSDIISGMHPIDVNSINDLHYLSIDNVAEIMVSDDKVVAIDRKGMVTEYDLDLPFDFNKAVSTRLSYMIGYIQAEKLVKSMYKNNIEYKITCDNIVTLQIQDNNGSIFLKEPNDILFSGEYKKYSKEDIARIGFICGQMAHSRV